MAATMPVCPWGFLDPDSRSFSPPPITTKQPSSKTFAQALNNSVDTPLSQLPRPCLKGDALSIKISESEYLAGISECKTRLHGRLILSKGDSPIKVADLRSKLSKKWNPIDSWKMVPLGKGFYEFTFASLEDLRSV